MREALPFVWLDWRGSPVRLGQAERAARLLGTAKTALEASNAPLPMGPADQAAYDRYLAATKAQLDSQVFAAAWEEGRRMTLSQAVACALEQSPI